MRLHPRIIRGGVFLLSAVLFTLILSVVPASAANFPLTDCLETSLTNALTAANSNGQNDTITLLSGCTYTLTATLFIEADNQHALTIQGSGAALSGNDMVRLLHVNPGAGLYLNNLTLQHGMAEHLMNGGGLVNEGQTSITNSAISDNQAHMGAGIDNQTGAISIINTTFADNVAEAMGYGAGITNHSGIVSVTGSTFSNNTAFEGASIYNFEDGTVNVTNVTFSGNTADTTFDGAGGIYNNRGIVTVSGSGFYDNIGGGLHNESGTLTMIRSTVAGSDGDGIYNESTNNEPATLSISYSTFSGNSSEGIYVKQGSVSINNSTFAYNRIGLNSVGTVNLSHSLLAYNTLLDCSGLNITASFVNWIEDGPCSVAMPGSLTLSGDPHLGLLQVNPPASTQTHALLPESLAINVWTCFGGSGFADQRGVPIPQGKACDLGAYEFDGVFPPRIAEDTYTTPINTPLVVSVPGVLANDDGMPSPTVIPASGEAGGWGGSFAIAADGSFTYIPPSGLGGAGDIATFSYTISNGQLPDATATVRITVASPPDAAPVQNNYPTGQPVLTWTALTWATEYEVQIANNPAFTGAQTYTPGNVTDFTPPLPPLDDGLWYWRVRGLRGTTVGSWSATVRFMVKVP